jgi:hypothetical protein
LVERRRTFGVPYQIGSSSSSVVSPPLSYPISEGIPVGGDRTTQRGKEKERDEIRSDKENHSEETLVRKKKEFSPPFSFHICHDFLPFLFFFLFSFIRNRKEKITIQKSTVDFHFHFKSAFGIWHLNFGFFLTYRNKNLCGNFIPIVFLLKI